MGEHTSAAGGDVPDGGVPAAGGAATAANGSRAGHDFIRAIVAADLEAGRHSTIVTRFPPEPNGFLHIGHAKSIVLNFGLAGEVPGARCHLRFDDTNPETEDVRYVEAMQHDIRWLGYDWGEYLYFASDYFDRMYTFAEELITKGLAYVDSQSDEQIRENRGTVTEPGTPSPFRERTVDENLDLFRRMRAGEFPNGAHVLRAKIDMASRNMVMRDPLLYRIRHAHHYRTGSAWCIYPLYDYAHPIEDALEHVTHSLCTLEFENNRELYDWLVASVSVPSRPRQIEFARLSLDYTITSKRKLLQLVQDARVTGWDDPRMPTIAGLRRRGVTPEAIRTFCEMVGVARADSRIDIGKLEYAIRDDLNQRAPRVLCVLDPIRVTVTNWPAADVEMLDAPYWPRDVPNTGSRALPFTRELFIERDDFAETPPKGFHRLAPGGEVRLRHAYIMRCDEVVKDDAGAIVELRCTIDRDTRGGAAPADRKVKGTIHWVSATHSLPCTVRLYDRLFSVADPDAAATAGDRDFRDFLNPESLVVRRNARIEAGVTALPPDTHLQFERLGFFIRDAVDSDNDTLVYNRTVTLRDSWAAQMAAREGTTVEHPGRPQRSKAPKSPKAPKPPKSGVSHDEAGAAAGGAAGASADAAADAAAGGSAGSSAGRSATEAAGESATGAAAPASPLEIVMREAYTARLFEDALASGADAQATANWIVNELPRAGGGRPVIELAITGTGLAELIGLVRSDVISNRVAREVLAEMVTTGAGATGIVDRRGLRQVGDDDALRPIVAEVVAAHPDKVAEYRGGRSGLLGFFVGQVMRQSGGRAKPERVSELVREALG